MKGKFAKVAAAVAGILTLLTSCSDKRADAGLTGPNPLIAITLSGSGSLEPLFFSELTVERSGKATLSMHNVKGDLANKTVAFRSGTFETIATDLAEFRRTNGFAQSKCRGVSDVGPVMVSWRYASGHVGSYSVAAGCQQSGERRFLQAATAIAGRVGLQTSIDRAPKPQ